MTENEKTNMADNSIETANIKEQQSQETKVPKYIIFRVTPELYAHITEKADAAGISVSRLMRSLAEGYHPKARMTKEQEEALNQLSDARGELSHIRNALAGKTQNERLEFFRDADFMTWWVNATTKLMLDWLTIERYFRHG